MFKKLAKQVKFLRQSRTVLVPGFKFDKEMEGIVIEVGFLIRSIGAIKTMDYDPTKEGDRKFVEKIETRLKSLIEQDKERLLAYLKPYLDMELDKNWLERQHTYRGERLRLRAAMALKGYLAEEK